MKRMQRLYCVITILALVTLYGCQATPTENVVVNKNSDTLQDGIQASSNPSQALNVPDRWNDTIEFSPDLTVHIDAVIDKPKVDKYPVVRVIPHKFNNDDAKAIAGAFMPGKKLYKPITGLAKQDIEDKIIQLQMQLTQGDMYEVKDQNPEEWADYSAEINSQIEKLQKQYETAPDTIVREEGVLEFQQDTDEDTTGLNKEDIPVSNGRHFIDVQADNGDEAISRLKMWTYDTDNRNISFYLDGSEYGIGNDISENTENLRNVKLSLADAEAMAVKGIKDIGISQMQVAAKGSIIIEDWAPDKQGMTLDEMPQCFVFCFTRNINGVQTTNETQGVGANPAETYMEPWQYESITVCVNDNGIIEMYWTSPAEVTDTLNENVVLLPFDKVQDIFKNKLNSLMIIPFTIAASALKDP